jgi:hypothetical protein
MNTKKRKRQKEERTSVLRPLSWNIYATGPTRLDPGFNGIRVVDMCFLNYCVALPIVCQWEFPFKMKVQTILTMNHDIKLLHRHLFH